MVFDIPKYDMRFEKILRSLIKRNLTRLGSQRYHDVQSLGMRPDAVDFLLQENEILIGVYENSVGTFANALALTTTGLHIHDGNLWNFVAYDTIQDITFPQTKSLDEPKTLLITLTTGEQITLPVEGQPDPINRPHLRDVWVFGNFLKKVVEAAHDKEKFPPS